MGHDEDNKAVSVSHSERACITLLRIQAESMFQYGYVLLQHQGPSSCMPPTPNEHAAMADVVVEVYFHRKYTHHDATRLMALLTMSILLAS